MGEAKEILRMVEEKEFRKVGVQTRAVSKLQESLFQEKGNYDVSECIERFRQLEKRLGAGFMVLQEIKRNNMQLLTLRKHMVEQERKNNPSLLHGSFVSKIFRSWQYKNLTYVKL